MTHRERILRTLAGKPTDSMPWAPRLDLWYTANRSRDTLPAEYRRASLDDIIEDQGFGLHSVIPDFQSGADPESLAHRGLGNYSAPTYQTVSLNP